MSRKHRIGPRYGGSMDGPTPEDVEMFRQAWDKLTDHQRKMLLTPGHHKHPGEFHATWILHQYMTGQMGGDQVRPDNGEPM